MPSRRRRTPFGPGSETGGFPAGQPLLLNRRRRHPILRAWARATGRPETDGTAMSYFRTAILLAGMTALFMSVGFLVGGGTGMVVALGFAVATNLFAYWRSGDMVLSMYGAREIDPRSAPDLY